MCSSHSKEFIASARIALAYHVQGHSVGTSAKNPFLIYGSARSLVELHAVLSYVHRRLTKLQGSAAWEEDGQAFFRLLTRARYGTSNPAKRDLVASEAGVSAEQMKPFHVLTCIQELGKTSEFTRVTEYYDVLCDYVHPNLSSQTIAAGDAYMGQLGVGPGGHVWMTPNEGLNYVYKYPADEHAKLAVTTTICEHAKHAQAAIDLLDRWPGTPFDRERLNSFSGLDADGVFVPTQPPQQRYSAGRNEPCPCGSGKKFKKCHGFSDRRFESSIFS